MARSRLIPSAGWTVLALDPPLVRLGQEQAPEILAVMESASTPGVSPPGFVPTLCHALELFNSNVPAPLKPVVGTFGYYGANNLLLGFLSLAWLDLDGEDALEFYIFFRPEAPRGTLPLEAARQLTTRARAIIPNLICTLIYPPNERAKRFYAKAGFAYRCEVVTEGLPLELWAWAESSPKHLRTDHVIVSDPMPATLC